MKYIKAPASLEVNSPEEGKTSLFLAGSISGAKNWQASITKIKYKGFDLETLFHIYNPRRDNYDSLNPLVEEEQIFWEFNAIHFCQKILFWFSNETVAPITLFELGSALHTHKYSNIFIGIDPKYARKNDVIIQTTLRNKFLSERIVYSQKDLVKQIIDNLNP